MVCSGWDGMALLCRQWMANQQRSVTIAAWQRVVCVVFTRRLTTERE